MNSAFVGYKLKSVVARITTLALDLLRNKFRCCKLWQYVAQSRSEFYSLQQTFNLSFASQLATLHNTCDWSIFLHQKCGKDGE